MLIDNLRKRQINKIKIVILTNQYLLLIVMGNIIFKILSEVDFEELMNQKKSKHIEPLPQLDHSKIEYPEFDKNFYIEH